METVETRDGLALVMRHWPLPTARRRVLIVHGLGEHAGRYDDVARSLNQAGYAVSAHDQRGHGRSPGPRGGIPAADSLCADLACVIDALQHVDGRTPVLLGHSLGGLVAARFVAESLVQTPAAWRRAVPALMLSSPALDAGMSGPQKALLALLGALAPGLAVGNGLEAAWLSRDPAVVRAYEQDPLVHDRVTARLVRFIVDAGQQVRRLAPLWRTPTLLLWAGADRCVAPAGSAAFAAAAPTGCVQHQVWPALRHEIFNEPEREQVLRRVLAFLQQLPDPA
ncbi:MAG: lysophospholipase [Burkholderiaceae bacterium]|nr:lysophospholipase [Burkholderiaceae bacterium]